MGWLLTRFDVALMWLRVAFRSLWPLFLLSAFCFRLVVALGGKLIQVEICKLSLWIKTAACGKQLTSLDHTIREGNSVISAPAVQPKAFDWQAAFPEPASTAEVEPAAKRRKRRKEGKRSSDEAARAADLTYPTQRVLLDLELWGAEIDQQAVLNPRGTQVAQDLGHMFVRQGLGCFQSDIVDSFLLRHFAAEGLSPPVPSDGTCPLYPALL